MLSCGSPYTVLGVIPVLMSSRHFLHILTYLHILVRTIYLRHGHRLHFIFEKRTNKKKSAI